jgi:hypothetical protein
MIINEHWLIRLVQCVRSLGLRNGLRYWRLQNAAINDPNVALFWAHEARRRAKKLRKSGQVSEAEAFEKWAKGLKRTHRDYMNDLNQHNPTNQ